MSTPYRILVVDDDDPTCYATAHVLKEVGYVTAEAATGEETFALVKQWSPDLIVLDVNLPDISGWEICRRLKGDPLTASISILHLSATYTGSASIAAGLEGGADGYLTQPVDPLVLAATARALLRARAAETRALVAERERAQAAEIMAAEVNHRMKNNLMLISGMLEVQLSAQPEGSQAAAALQQALSRISSLCAVHEQMLDQRAEAVQLKEILERIARIASEGASQRNPEVSVEGDSVTVSSKAGSTLAIVSNELITNALKYGDVGSDGHFRVRVRLQGNGEELRLDVWNSGNPVPEGFDVGERKGLGLLICRQLVTRQLNGSLRLRPHDGGTLSEVAIAMSAIT